MKNSLYVYIEDHIKILLLAFLLGLFLAVVYDIFRITRTFLGCGVRIGDVYLSKSLPLIGPLKKENGKAKKKNFEKAILFIFDIIFSIFFTTSLLIFFYYTSDGVVRWFALLAVVIGFYLYIRTVGVITKKTAELILFAVITAFRYLCYFTVKPIVFIVSKLKKYIGIIYKNTVAAWMKKLLSHRSQKKIKEYTDVKLQRELCEFTFRVFGTEQKT